MRFSDHWELYLIMFDDVGTRKRRLVCLGRKAGLLQLAAFMKSEIYPNIVANI